MVSAMVAIGIVGIPEFARIVHGQTLSLRERDFVEAGHAIGLPGRSILIRHIVPNALAPILVRATLGMGYAILTAASLSFIGLGAQPPDPEWGVLISDGRGYIISGQWWMTTFPGLAIATSIPGYGPANERRHPREADSSRPRHGSGPRGVRLCREREQQRHQRQRPGRR